MASFTSSMWSTIASGLGMAGGTGLGVMGANKQAGAGQDASQIQTQMQLQALKQQQEAQEYARQTMAPYTGYGLMGMEQMLGTVPMQQTMGGNAQNLIRQQQPTLTERTDKHLGEDFTQKMFGNLLGEEGKVSVKDWLTGKRSSLDQKDAEKFLLAKAISMLKGNPTGATKERPWEQWEYKPSINIPKYGEVEQFSPATSFMGGFNSIPRRQFGGPIRSSQPYLVGEAGPEVIVPQQAGQVIPNVQGNLLAGGIPNRTTADIKKDMMRKALGLNPLGQNKQPSPTMYQGGQNLLGDAPLMNNYGVVNPPALPGTGGPNTGLYMLDPATRSLMDWETLVNQPDTPVKKGILEQGPPSAGPAPVREEFDFAKYQESPWYQQGLDQGINALQRSAIGQGGLYSGATGQALNQFGQDYAMSKYMPARQQHLQESESDFNRWLQGGQFGLNEWLQGTLYPTQEMIRIGQNSAVGQANNALNSAAQNANILSNIGSSQASGILGSGGAYSGLYNSFGNLLNQGAGMGMNYLMR